MDPNSPITLHTCPKKKRSRVAPAVGPSPHGRVLPLLLPRAHLNVVGHVLPPVVPHRHEDTEQDQDYGAAASDCRRQEADLREGS